VEEGFAAVLNRKQRATPAVPRIFDGEKEGQTYRLGLFQTAQGTRTLDLAAVGEQVVELGIVDRASDSTIGRALKKTFYSAIAGVNGSSRRRPTVICRPGAPPPVRRNQQFNPCRCRHAGPARQFVTYL
jgi:hypothetical protein